MAKHFEPLPNRWSDSHAAGLTGLDRLVYRSNLLGQDQRITNTGGGNTSAKLIETDPLTGQTVEVLWVKGSGGDLRTSNRSNFASLYQSKLLALQSKYAEMPNRGPKTPAEDEMVGLYPHCAFNLNPRAASIDTPLHAFVPFKHVDHTHPNAVIAIAAAKNGERLTREIYGDEIAWLPWQRPGIELGLRLAEVCESQPNCRGAILGQHGLINWADSDKECYTLSLELIDRAAEFIARHDRGDQTFGGQAVESWPEDRRRGLLVDLLPWLRGQLSCDKRVIATVQDDSATMQFVNSVDAERLSRLGTSCPDHFLRTKIRPMFVKWAGDLAALKNAIAEKLPIYRSEYAKYYQTCKLPDSPAMRDPNPTVILIPGVGMIAWGKDKSESRVTAEFYRCAIEVIRGAEAIDEYIALPAQEAFDIEYWLLEEAKLKRMPPEKELARQVIAVVGAGNGIGQATALRLANEGAHIVCADLDPQAAEATAQIIRTKLGDGIGVAGSGISACGPAIGLGVNIADRNSMCKLMEDLTLAYGGLDGLAITAGVFISANNEGKNQDADWAKSFAINVTGAYIVADEAHRLWKSQNLPASLVLTTSANAVVAKRGSMAYDTSKAAANHLVRELAVTFSPLVRVNGVAPATVVAGSTMFPRDRVVASLSKYGIAFDAAESDVQLRDKLSEFYARRTLTQSPITTADQAEAIFLLLSARLSKTTGQILAVDGGLTEAFLR